jgi:hypothetical protein
MTIFYFNNYVPRHEDILREWRNSSKLHRCFCIRTRKPVQRHALAARLPGKKQVIDTHWVGHWTGPRTSLHAAVKRNISVTDGKLRWLSSSQPSKYNDWAIPAPTNKIVVNCI